MTNNNKRLLSEPVVIHMCVMVAVWCAHALVASPSKARMDSCNTSSKAGTSKGNTTSKGDTTKTCCGGYNGSSRHNRGCSCNCRDKVSLMRV